MSNGQGRIVPPLSRMSSIDPDPCGGNVWLSLCHRLRLYQQLKVKQETLAFILKAPLGDPFFSGKKVIGSGAVKEINKLKFYCF